MMYVRFLVLSSALGAVLAVQGCSNDSTKDVFSGTSEQGTGGTMEIVSCSLGCNTFQTTQINCNVNLVAVNEEIRIEFSQPVDKASFNASTFRVKQTLNGSVPSAKFLIDPSNPNRVIYQPALTFNSSGTPIFGLEQGKSYEIFVPGVSGGGTDPVIKSQSQRPLGVPLRCIVTAGSGVNDPVPGPPTVQVRVNIIQKDALGNPVIDPATGIPFLGASVQAGNATDVHRRSNIQFTFNDIMNPATLVNPVTMESPSIRVFVDPDGNVADSTDQVELFGSFQLSFPTNQLTTLVTFDPATDFPSAGPPSQISPRRVVVVLPNTIVDLGGNGLANAGTTSFVPERLVFPKASIPQVGGEAFSATTRRDADRTGAGWGPPLSNQFLALPASPQIQELVPGFGGGSGRLGDLRVAPGQVLTLYTDGQRPAVQVTAGICIGQAVNGMGTPLFVDQKFGPAALVHDPLEPESSFACPGNTAAMPAIPALANDSRNVETTLIDNYAPATDLPGDQVFVVRDGLFEFATVTIESGAVLRFVGPIAPRLFVRGGFVHRGRIEINGKDADQLYDPATDAGGSGSAAGPGGGVGGRGGLRPSGGGDLATISGIPNPLVTSLADSDGLPGMGVPVPSGTPGVPDVLGGGLGGTRWPNATACVGMSCDLPPTTNPSFTDFGGVIFSIIQGCGTFMVAAPGSGAGKTIPGGAGIAKADSVGAPAGSLPPPTPPGAGVAFDTSLSPEGGFLTGGGGGGGGGGHVLGTQRANLIFQGCVGTLIFFNSNSGAGGAGGGGAIQIQAGSKAEVTGVIDASGGRGGRPNISPLIDFTLTAATPGGSGAGGSILLQTLELQLATLTGRLNVSGGTASIGVSTSVGGSGSMGFVRVEAGSATSATVPAFASVSQTVTPVPSTDPSAPNTWLSVEPGGWSQLDTSGFFMQPHPNTGDTMVYFPDSFSGAQSCWMRPAGNFFRLTFDADVPGTPGWNMIVSLLDGSLIPYRKSTLDAGYGATVEGFFRNMNGGLTSMLQSPDPMNPFLGSPIIVRFQGARAIAEIPNLCDVPLTGASSPLQFDSVTPWVLHPAELNVYWESVFPSDPGEVSKRQPTLIRYQILFNKTVASSFPFRGIDNIEIFAQPD